MVKRVCRSCQANRGIELTFTVMAPHKGARQWYVIVCQDCWRAFEALLDGASIGVQPALDIPGRANPQWFL